MMVLPAILLQGCATGTFYTILDPYKKLSDKDKDENILSFGMQPFTLDAPLLKEKGEKMLQFGATSGISVHGAYAITDHLGLYIGASLASRKDDIDQSSVMYVLKEVWDDGILLDSDSGWVTGNLSGTAKISQGHLEGGIVFFRAGERDWHHEMIIGAGTTNAITKHELHFKFQGTESPFDMQESRTSRQVFLQYNLGYRNESGEIAWMNRVGRAWQFQREAEPYIQALHDDVLSPYDFYSTGIRLGAGKARWHVYAQIERVFPLGSTRMRWKRNQFSVGVVIRPFRQFIPDQGNK